MAKKKKNRKKNNEVINIDVIENDDSLNDIKDEEKSSDEHITKEIKIIKKVVRKQNNDIRESEPTKETKESLDKSKKLIIYAVISVLLVLAFVFGVLPLIKESSARSKYNNGNYEEAINILNNMYNRSSSAEIIDNCEKAIAKRSAEYILANDNDLKSKNLTFVDVDNYKCSLDYKNKSEVSSFAAEYKNSYYTYKASYIVNNSRLNDGSWNVMDYSLVDSELIPVIQSNQTIADAVVLKDYPKAQFKSTNNVSSSVVEYIYEMISSERPLYKTGYILTANCIYDPVLNVWKVNEVKKDLIDSVPIPYKSFITSIFTISLPETWYVTRNEDTYSWNNKDGSHTSFNYSYSFFSDRENNTRVMDIYVYFDNTNNSTYTGGSNAISSRNIGKGTYSQYEKSINVTFWPKIRNMNSSFNINVIGINLEELQPIIDSIVLSNNTYKLKVIEGPINIRDNFSTKTGNIISKANIGSTFTSSRAMFNEGYTWFNIGENRWIADSNGQWILVE